MATAYTPILKLALPVTGELNGAWGDVVNNNITSMVEQSVAGLATINTWIANSHTLTSADGTTSESRCAMLVIDDDGAGNPSAAATVVCPTATKSYIVRNLCGQTVTVKTSAGTGVAVPNNQAALVFCDGTNVVTGAFNGDVVGPATSTNNAIVTFDGTTGKIIKDNSGATISAGVITATGFSGPLNGTVGATTPTTGKFTTVESTITTGTAPLVVASTTNVANLNASSLSGATFAAPGSIGSGTAGSGAFTTLSATGVTTLSAGTVSAPALTTSGDTNTGVFFPAADTIAIVEGGVEVIRINSSSNVGIGTTTPGAKLAVVGTGYSPAITITDGATLNWDTSLGQVAQVTLGGNRTFAAPTNLVDGGFYSLLIIQDGTGSRTISWNAVFDFAGGTAPTLSTAAGAKDLITWRSDGTNMLEVGRSLGVA